MNPDAMQALISAILLAVGVSLRGSIFGSVLSFSPGLFLAVLGAVGLADYALAMVLEYWRKKPQ